MRAELSLFPNHYKSGAEYHGEAFREASIAAKQWQKPLKNEILQSKWHKQNWDKIFIGGENWENEMVKNENINFDHFINILYLEREPRFSMEEIR